jgi:hypothetical protein
MEAGVDVVAGIFFFLFYFGRSLAGVLVEQLTLFLDLDA